MTKQNESNPIELNNDNGHMDNQTSDPIELFASGQTAFPNMALAAKYIAAGNGDLVTQLDLGGVVYDTNLRSRVEPLLTPGTTDLKNNLIGLRIHNPDGTELIVNMHQYASSEASSTGELRYSLYEVYKREAETKYGTSVFTQNALYFKQISWTSPDEADSLSNETQQSFVKGELSGAVYNKTPDIQNDVLYQQHNGMQDAVERSANQLLNKNTLKPDSNIDSKPITLQDLLTYVPSDKHHEFLTKLSDKLNETQPNNIGNQDELTS